MAKSLNASDVTVSQPAGTVQPFNDHADNFDPCDWHDTQGDDDSKCFDNFD
jgi:hypothetical protein